MMFKVLLKPGVRIRQVNWGTIIFFDTLLAATRCIQANMVITSMNDSVHRTSSKHYKDRAGDIRARHLSEYNIYVLMNFLGTAVNPNKCLIADNLFGAFELVQFEWRFRLNKNAQWVKAKTNIYKPEWEKVIQEYKKCTHEKVCHIHIDWEEG